MLKNYVERLESFIKGKKLNGMDIITSV